MIPAQPSGRRPASDLLEQPGARGVLISASRDPDAKLTYVDVGGAPGAAVVVKIPSTADAGTAVEREGRMLVEMRRAGLGEVAGSVPRYVGSLDVEGRPVLVSTAVPGSSMNLRYHAWRHTARRAPVAEDLRMAGDWLASFQAATARAAAPVTWPAETADALRGRWDGDELLPAAMDRLQAARSALAACRTPVTAVHGDFWFGNLLTAGSAVVGVVDWEAGVAHGCPLRDLARFTLSYSLYLDRHTRPGRPVAGHPGLVRRGIAPGVRYALNGSGWLPDLVRGFLTDGLARLGVPPARWYDVALTGVAEVAASANDDGFGHDHLELLAGLPLHPRRHRRSRR